MFVVIGTTTADILVRGERPPSQSSADGFRSGNVVFTDRPPRLLLGGNGGISAYVLAGLGVPTVLCSVVGQDPFGHTLSAWLETRGVNLEGVLRSDAHATSTSVILFADATSQVVYHHVGAAARLGLGDIPRNLPAEAGVLLASSYPLMSGMRGGGFAAVLAETDAAGGITALDIGPAIGAPVTVEEIVPLLPNTHYLLGNGHEIGKLAGADDWESAASRLLDAGVRNLIVKRGRDGASMRGQGTAIDVPGFDVAANVAVGAGDAFNAGFLCAVDRGLPLDQALRLGNAVAALVVSGERGALDAPSWDEVETFLARNG